MSELPRLERDDESAWRRFRGTEVLSGLLIAVALMALVVLARPRGQAPAAQVARSTPVPTHRAQKSADELALRDAVSVPTARPALSTPTRAAPAATPTATPTPPPVTVYVAGEVRRPGMYTLPPGSRIGDAVRRAGGMTKRADALAINLALRLRDEMQVTVPPKSRPPAARTQPPVVEPTTAPATPSPAPEEEPTRTPTPAEVEGETDTALREDGGDEPPAETRGEDEPPAASEGGVVNLNTATQAELESLPGIGPSKARAIIEYREAHGPFRRAEDLQDVKGIGPKTWEALEDKVTV